jgi:alpha-glucosidase
VQNWWAEKIKDWTGEYHFDGIWNDMDEPSDFVHANKLFEDAADSKGRMKNQHNLYGYNMALSSKQGLESVSGNRALNITRSGYPGVSKYSTIWHGDNHAWWEHLRLALRTAVNYSLCGAFYTGSDIPGFTGNPPDDLALRFFQLGAFLPLFRGHSIYFAKDKEPYAYSGETNKLIRKVILLRYSLLREWYTGFMLSLKSSASPMLPVFDEKGMLVQDQFLLFNKFLVAPVAERDQSKKLIYLPEGNWYKLGDTQNKSDGGQWISIDVNLETLPVFVKEGSVVTLNEPGGNTKATFDNPEKQEIYKDGNGEAQGFWYDDDGISEDSSPKEFKLIFKNGELNREEIVF